MKSLCWFSLDREGLDWRVGWWVCCCCWWWPSVTPCYTYTHVWIVLVFFSPFCLQPCARRDGCVCVCLRECVGCAVLCRLIHKMLCNTVCRVHLQFIAVARMCARHTFMLTVDSSFVTRCSLIGVLHDVKII